MALDYHDLRVAWDTATRSDAWTAPKREFRPLSMPMFWTWLAETAEQMISLIRWDYEAGRKMAVSAEERRYFCRSLARDLPPHLVFIMHTELGMGEEPKLPDRYVATRRSVVEAAAQVLDALVAEE